MPGGPNIPFTVPATGDAVTFSYDATSHVLTVHAGNGPTIDIGTPRAYWLARNYIGWDTRSRRAADRSYRLYSAPTGGLAVDDDRRHRRHVHPVAATTRPGCRPPSGEVPGPGRRWARSRSRAVARPAVQELLSGQVAAWPPSTPAGNLVDGAGLQMPGVLDDLYAGADAARRSA